MLISKKPYAYIPYKCYHCKDANWLIECACGRPNCLVPMRTKQGKMRQYNRQCYEYGKRGYKTKNFKGGRVFDKDTGYWSLRMQDYFSSNSHGYVKEHIYFYQEKNKLCMLHWGVVHHIDENTENNMPWNLQGMMRSNHIIHHNKGNRNRRGKLKDRSNYYCFLCGSKTTAIVPPRGKSKSPQEAWFHLPWDKINWYCRSCYGKEIGKIKRKKPIRLP